MPLDWEEFASRHRIALPQRVETHHGTLGKVFWLLSDFPRAGYKAEFAEGVSIGDGDDLVRCRIMDRPWRDTVLESNAEWLRWSLDGESFQPGNLIIHRNSLRFVDEDRWFPPHPLTEAMIEYDERKMMVASYMDSPPYSWKRLANDIIQCEPLLTALQKNSFAFSFTDLLKVGRLVHAPTGSTVYVSTDREWAGMTAGLRNIGEDYIYFFLSDRPKGTQDRVGPEKAQALQWLKELGYIYHR